MVGKTLVEALERGSEQDGIIEISFSEDDSAVANKLNEIDFYLRDLTHRDYVNWDGKADEYIHSFRGGFGKHLEKAESREVLDKFWSVKGQLSALDAVVRGIVLKHIGSFMETFASDLYGVITMYSDLVENNDDRHDLMRDFVRIDIPRNIGKIYDERRELARPFVHLMWHLVWRYQNGLKETDNGSTMSKKFLDTMHKYADDLLNSPDPGSTIFDLKKEIWGEK